MMRFEKKRNLQLQAHHHHHELLSSRSCRSSVLIGERTFFMRWVFWSAAHKLHFFWWILYHSVLHMAYFINISNIQYKLNIGFLHLLPKYLACFSFWQKLVQLYLSPDIFQNPKTEVRIHIIRSVTRLDSCNKLF